MDINGSIKLRKENTQQYSGLVDRRTHMALTHEKKDRYLYPLLLEFRRFESD